MNHIRNIAYNIVKYVILGLFGLIAAYLVYLAGFTTAALSYEEHVFLIGDSFIANLACAAGLVALCVLLSRSRRVRALVERVNADPAASARYRRYCLAAIGIAGAATVLLAQGKPRADQQALCVVADAWLRGDYSAFAPGGYVDMYPNQLGLILLIYLGEHIFGANNYIAFQLFNVLALVSLYRDLAALSDAAGRPRFEGLAIILAGGLFLPGLMYVTFVYGTLIGLALSVRALRRAVDYCAGHKIKDLILAALLSLLAIIVKNNYAIFAVGLIVFLLVRLIRDADLRMLLPVGLLIAALLGSAFLVNAVTRAVTGQTVGPGASKLSWAAMGLQESDELYDGWWNHYNENSYIEAGCDAEAQGAAAAEVIAARVDEFRADPAMALRFFAGKNASQWVNPDYEGLWVIRGMSTALNYSRWLNDLLAEDGVARATAVLNYAQFPLYLGALLFILLSRKKGDISLYLCAVAVGGFVFHTVWEAKGQYTLTYAMLMIPLAVDGYGSLVNALTSLRKRPARQRARFGACAAAFLLGACLIGWGNVKPLNDVFLRAEDAEAYWQYVDSHTYLRVASGDYRLSARTDGGALWLATGAASEDDPLAVAAVLSETEAGPVTVVMAEDTPDCTLLFHDSGRCLDVPDGKAKEGKTVRFYGQNYKASQKWRLHRSADGESVNLLFRYTWALTWDAKRGRAHLSAFTDAPNQRWLLERH